MPSLVSTSTPLAASTPYVSNANLILQAVSLTGSVYADVAGTLYIEQGGDGTDWDVINSFTVTDGTAGVAVNIPVVSQYFRVRYVNGDAQQTVFRLYVDARDISGLVLGPPEPPTAGGHYVVLFRDPSHGWQFVGRFDGSDQIAALRSAAIDRNKNGVYASFSVSDAVVGLETLSTTADYEPTAF